MTEIERLRADLEAMERLWETVRFGESAGDFHRIKSKVRDKIAQLEAEAADPWREAKEFCNDYRGDKGRFGIAAGYIDHLTAENERLTKRVAELEAAASDVTAILELTEEGGQARNGRLHGMRRGKRNHQRWRKAASQVGEMS